MAAERRAAALKAHFSAPGAQARPVFTSLNADAAWLVSIPIPAASTASSSPPDHHHYFHIVMEPWLDGTADTFGGWLLGMSRLEADLPSAATSGAAVEAIAREIDDAAVAALGSRKTNSRNSDDSSSSTSRIGALVLSINLDDHLHIPSLRSFSPSIPVVAAPDCMSTIKGMDHFATVVRMPLLSPAATPAGKEAPAWRWKEETATKHPELAAAGLPSWLSFFRMEGHFFLNFCLVVLWESLDGKKHEALLSSPHGIRTSSPSVQAFCHRAEPEVEVVALLHALKDSWFVGLMRNTLGVMGGLELERAARPKVWLRSADAEMVYGGFLSLFITDVKRSVEEALEEEARVGRLKEVGRRPNFVDLGNGGCHVAE